MAGRTLVVDVRDGRMSRWPMMAWAGRSVLADSVQVVNELVDAAAAVVGMDVVAAAAS